MADTVAVFPRAGAVADAAAAADGLVELEARAAAELDGLPYARVGHDVPWCEGATASHFLARLLFIRRIHNYRDRK